MQTIFLFFFNSVAKSGGHYVKQNQEDTETHTTSSAWSHSAMGTRNAEAIEAVTRTPATHGRVGNRKTCGSSRDATLVLEEKKKALGFCHTAGYPR